ncbi:DNA mismatch repair protein MSH3 isoform X1 [Lycium barbarum]|uniref:DNA mismatch repair protein MSH3 isoform X1 n=1 Tax=Lycium barbarum TaxID=112863 RepID=UPI00293E50D2|nr:DNA mismatch repair protein MSH3 isoform X1 [Lycium barbarum]XP_060203586.1 DNA mismatch repair protein MSH3 isoform X1 [Lycium barbarum]
MGKPKQQVISRFFAPKPNINNPSTSSTTPSTPPPKITATVNFSPAKRLRASQLISPHTNKLPYDDHPIKPTKTPKLVHNPTLHQKFLDKLLEPSYDLQEPSKCQETANPKYTPLEQQVLELKERYPDVMLMIEVGYKYRFFGQDAENAARVLSIYAHMDHNFLTASVPTFRLNVHVRRLVSAGYKVGVVKQTETAAIKAHGKNKLGPFGRGLSALYTKATLEASEDVGGGDEGFRSCNNYLVCVVEKGIDGDDVKLGVVGVEVSTGDVVFGEFNDNFMRAGLEAMILNLLPAELLVGRPISKQTEKMLLAYAGPASNVRVEDVSSDRFSDGGALAEVMSLYEGMQESYSLDVQEREEAEMKTHECNQIAIQGIMAMPDLAIQALALIVRHLKQFGLERVLCLGASFRPFSSNMEMTLSVNALQQLEVLKNNFDGSESGSLLQCMNQTLTVFGARLLRHWVTHPLRDRNMIDARLDAVSEIAESMKTCQTSHTSDLDVESADVTISQPDIHHVISSVLSSLGKSPDIQRGITRIFHRKATASEFIAVTQAILLAAKQLQQLCIEEDKSMKLRETLRSVLLRKLISIASSSTVISAASKLLSALNKEAAERRALHNLFIVSDGKVPEVAEGTRRVELANEKLDSLILMYRKQLRIRNLEYMSVAGITHLLELPLDTKVPPDWVKVNSTKKAIRYHPPEVLVALDELALANEQLTVICQAAWNNFLTGFGGYFAEFQAAVQALASLDCLNSLAILSRNKNYVRPLFVKDEEAVQIHICSGRHPVLERVLQDNFVPNDTDLHAEREYCQIVTGPNMGGKSCYIRQVALIALMAQVGSFVPAFSAKLHVLDGIYTRMGASDSIQQGRSTFLEELSEASDILKKSSASSLVILDELGRGTSTHDGVAIAYATLKYLLEHKKCMVLFVTHYPEIVSIKNEFPGSVGPYHVSYLTSQRDVNGDFKSNEKMDHINSEDITYLYKLAPGVSERSFGFKVAQLAQLPVTCIQRAVVIAGRLEAAVCKYTERNQTRRSSSLSYKERSCKESESVEDVLEPDCLSAGRVEGLDDISELYRELFLNLNFAFLEEHGDERRLQFLMQARSLAAQLIIR